jgi:hypothetical protein
MALNLIQSCSFIRIVAFRLSVRRGVVPNRFPGSTQLTYAGTQYQ